MVELTVLILPVNSLKTDKEIDSEFLLNDMSYTAIITTLYCRLMIITLCPHLVDGLVV